MVDIRPLGTRSLFTQRSVGEMTVGPPAVSVHLSPTKPQQQHNRRTAPRIFYLSLFQTLPHKGGQCFLGACPPARVSSFVSLSREQQTWHTWPGRKTA